MRKFLVVFVCAVGVISCKYGGFKSYETKIISEFSGVWNRFKPLEGSFDIENLRKQYEVKVELSVINGFEYNQIPVEIVITSPSGQKNIINKILVIKDKEGNHIGKAEGDVWTIEQIIYPNKEFTELGKYEVSIQNRTQYYELFKVKSLSFTVASLKKKIKKEE